MSVAFFLHLFGYIFWFSVMISIAFVATTKRKQHELNERKSKIGIFIFLVLLFLLASTPRTGTTG